LPPATKMPSSSPSPRRPSFQRAAHGRGEAARMPRIRARSQSLEPVGIGEAPAALSSAGPPPELARDEHHDLRANSGTMPFDRDSAALAAVHGRCANPGVRDIGLGLSRVLGQPAFRRLRDPRNRRTFTPRLRATVSANLTFAGVALPNCRNRRSCAASRRGGALRRSIVDARRIGGRAARLNSISSAA